MQTNSQLETNETRHIRGVGEAVRSTVDGIWRIYKRLPVDYKGQPVNQTQDEGGHALEWKWFTVSAAKKLKDAIEQAKTATQGFAFKAK